MRWSEKLQALKVLKQATSFLKEHGELTQPARKKCCALALGLVLDGGTGKPTRTGRICLLLQMDQKSKWSWPRMTGALRAYLSTAGMEVPRAGTFSQPQERRCQYNVKLASGRT